MVVEPAEGGRGCSLRVQGKQDLLRLVSLTPRAAPPGSSARRNLTLEGALFSGEKLYAYANGQTLSGSYRAPGAAVASGDVHARFQRCYPRTVVWPGGTFPSSDSTSCPTAGRGARSQAARGGCVEIRRRRGAAFFIEWQGGRAFLAGYMYEASGNPLWYAVPAATPIRALLRTWMQYANGQTLTGHTGRRPILRPVRPRLDHLP